MTSKFSFVRIKAIFYNRCLIILIGIIIITVSLKSLYPFVISRNTSMPSELTALIHFKLGQNQRPLTKLWKRGRGTNSSFPYQSYRKLLSTCR